MIQGLKIKNPPGFEQKVFADVPEIFVSLDLGPLLRGELLHLPEVRLHVQEINIEKNEKGVSNVSLLSAVGGQAKKAPPPVPGKSMPFMLDRLELFTQAVSLGDVDSLACHPASTTHSFVTAETRAKNGITEGLIRLSVGIEHPDDLMADLEQALRHAV